jgi:hypothetical protein
MVAAVVLDYVGKVLEQPDKDRDRARDARNDVVANDCVDAFKEDDVDMVYDDAIDGDEDVVGEETMNGDAMA